MSDYVMLLHTHTAEVITVVHMYVFAHQWCCCIYVCCFYCSKSWLLL